jgi:hypothetical protein
MEKTSEFSGIRRYLEPDSPFPEELEIGEHETVATKTIDLGNDPDTGENIVRLLADQTWPTHGESSLTGESIPPPREIQPSNQDATRTAPISVVRRAIKELQTGELDERALLLIGDVDVNSPTFRRLYVEARCQSYLDSPLGRHHMPPLSLLNQPATALPTDGPARSNSEHPNRISHSQMLEMAKKNPWAINSLRDLFNHHGPLVTLVISSAMATALQIHLKILGGAHWQLPLLMVIMLLPAALHLRGMHGRDHLDFYKPLFGYLFAYLSAFILLYIFESYGEAILNSMRGSPDVISQPR